ncbi:RNA exonuclease 1 [Cichlidogyrus casuarinus]|uniref:RNA exonuclease 1 n=1 Tax=Cichlidogyrus casuarinus TaxID=1844966 RepID=A0ABD2QE00_9PLAT
MLPRSSIRVSDGPSHKPENSKRYKRSLRHSKLKKQENSSNDYDPNNPDIAIPNSPECSSYDKQFEAYTPRCDFFSDKPTYASSSCKLGLETPTYSLPKLCAFDLSTETVDKFEPESSKEPIPPPTKKQKEETNEKLTRLMMDMLSSDSESDSGSSNDDTTLPTQRPTAPLKWSVKIPMQIRIRYLDQFIEFYLKTCPERLAYKKALDCEQACHDESFTKSAYLALIVKRLKEFKSHSKS